MGSNIFSLISFVSGAPPHTYNIYYTLYFDIRLQTFEPIISHSKNFKHVEFGGPTV